jgi:hypothetical protein
MHLAKRQALFVQDWIGSSLLETREGNSIALVGGLAHFQQLIREKEEQELA